MKKPERWILLFFTVLWVLGGLFSCHPGKKGQASTTPPPPQTVILHSDTTQAKIKLLVFELSRDSLSPAGERCTFMHSQMAPGRLKNPVGSPGFVQPGDLICHFYNRQGKIIQTSIEEDPLTTPVEAFEENGVMNRHDLNKNSATLTLRVQHSPDIHQLLIGKVMPDKSVITLFELKL